MTEGISESSALLQELNQHGFAPPRRLFTAAQCDSILKSLRHEKNLSVPEWTKGYAPTCRSFYDVAVTPLLLDWVSDCLGPHFMLWGALLVTRKPGDRHSWHSDIESACFPGRTVSAWVGLKNTCRESSLRLIARSHTFGYTVQQVEHELGLPRGEIDDAQVLAHALQRDAESVLLQPEVLDGEVLLFDGKTWHASNNTRAAGVRVALLLQYAVPDYPLRMPEHPNGYLYPFAFRETLLPPCILLSGTSASTANRLVPPPPRSDWQIKPPVDSSLYRVPEFGPEDGRPWRIHIAFNGSTANVAQLEGHFSTLCPGVQPHPPHPHEEEETLFLLTGQAELLLKDADNAEIRSLPLTPHELVYYPSGFLHTLRNTGAEPLHYFIFKWRSEQRRSTPHLGFTQVPCGGLLQEDPAMDAGGRHMQSVLNGPTQHLRRLSVHFTWLEPGRGYEPHVDGYDVALLILSGEVESLGEAAGPGAVFFYAAGTPHGMKNVGSTIARYLVWEFHGEAARVPLRKSLASLFLLLRKQGFWQVAKKILRKLRGKTLRLLGRGGQGPLVRKP